MMKLKLSFVLLYLVLTAFGPWFIYRINKFGILNVFSREHVFLDERPLTEEVALDLTSRALKADGYDVTLLQPISRPKSEYKNKERFFARGEAEPNDGYVQWEAKNGEGNNSPFAAPHTSLKVWIRKQSREIHCRVLKQK